MNYKLSLALGLLLVGLLSQSTVAKSLFGKPQGSSVSPYSSAAEIEQNVDRIFGQFAESTSPGCALGVIRNGEFIYQKGYGMGSLELGVPLSPESVFYMASVSKQFTAASIVLAAEQGLLSLDDDIHKYIPELPDYGHPITIRQMLHQASGLPDILGLLGISGRNFEDLHPTAELMDLITHQKALNFVPGDEYLYSNTNYFLLAKVIKRATKKSLAQFADENIFKPLGMAHTRFYDDRTMVVPGRVAAYRLGQNGGFLVDWSINYDMVGGGGLMSNLDDLLLWDRNFYSNRLGNGTLVKEMQTRGVLNDGGTNNYALGLYMSRYRGLPIAEHDGGMFGYRTDILRFPDQKFTVVLLCNVSTADPAFLTRKVADIYLEKELQPLPQVRGVDPSNFAGKYFDSKRHSFTSFTVDHGNLMLQGHVLYPVGINRFEDPIIDAPVVFSDSKSGMKATVSYDNAVIFDGMRIGVLQLSSDSLHAYTGNFKSAELDAIYRLSVEHGSLVLRMNWNPPISLQPVVRDEFTGGGMTLVFRKGSDNHVSGLSVFAGWNDAGSRDESFKKLN